MEEEKKSFCSCLLDMSFTELVTAKIVKVLYMVGIGISGLVAVFFVLKAFGQSFGMGLLHVIAAPIIFVLMVVILRVKLELILTLFRIEENTRTPAPAGTAPEPAETTPPAPEITVEPEPQDQ